MRSHLCRRRAAPLPPSHRVAWDAGLKETRPSTWPHFPCHPQLFSKLARSSAASSAPAAASQTPHLAAPALLWLDSTARLAPGLRQLESVAGCARLSPPDGPCRRRRRCHRPATAAMSLAGQQAADSTACGRRPQRQVAHAGGLRRHRAPLPAPGAAALLPAGEWQEREQGAATAAASTHLSTSSRELEFALLMGAQPERN